MKTLLIASAVAIALGTAPAMAADIARPAPAPAYKALPPPVAVASWTGCYIAGGVGYGMWNQDNHGETFPGLVPTQNLDQTVGGRGWLGRAGVGCDYQITPRFVIGAFADYDWENIHGRIQDFNSGDVGNENLSHSWAAGGRIGYLPFPELMAFVSGGYTQAHYDAVTLLLNTTPNTPDTTFGAHTYNGWFIGSGAEYALNMDWIPISGLSWRTEYRYSSFQPADLQIFSVTPPGVTTGTAEHSVKTVQTITSSLIWRFNFGGPLATRY